MHSLLDILSPWLAGIFATILSPWLACSSLLGHIAFHLIYLHVKRYEVLGFQTHIELDDVLIIYSGEGVGKRTITIPKATCNRLGRHCASGRATFGCHPNFGQDSWLEPRWGGHEASCARQRTCVSRRWFSTDGVTYGRHSEYMLGTALQEQPGKRSATWEHVEDMKRMPNMRIVSSGLWLWRAFICLVLNMLL